MGVKRKRSTSIARIDEVTEDGILCSIISSLPMREAVKTCVLSPRWKHIWTQLSNLEFDGIRMFGRKPSCWSDFCLEGKTNDFIASVNSVLHQRSQSARVDILSIIYFLHKPHSPHIDAWVRFGLASKTRVLRLDLRRPYCEERYVREGRYGYDMGPLYCDCQAVMPTIELYDFPCHILKGPASSSIKNLILKSCSLRMPQGFDGLNNLKKIMLDGVNTTEEDLKHLLSNCSSTLCSLFIVRCQQLTTLCIPFHLTQLMTLEVLACDQLRKIEINAKNLITLRYVGGWVDFDTSRECSQLIRALLSFETDENVDHARALAKLSRNLPHLKYLDLEIRGVSKVPEDSPKDFINFSRLTHLDFMVVNKTPLLCLAFLLNGSPLLEEFDLKLRTRAGEKPPQPLRELRNLPEEHPHTCLKTVKISGFCGVKWQIEIALYLVNIAVELELMKIEKDPEKFREEAIEFLCEEVPLDVKLVFF